MKHQHDTTPKPIDDSEADRSKGHEYNILTNPYERMQYVHLTDELIRRLEGNTEDGAKPDVVVYLDKSARPVSWMVNELWDTLAREPGTQYDENVIPEKPKTAFINVDSERQYTRDDVANLRALFTREVIPSGEDASGKETYFDDKRILVVDEEGVSHATSNKAIAFLKLAFPETESIDKFVWLDQGPVSNYGGRGSQTTFDTDKWRYSDNESSVGGRPLIQTARWFNRRDPKIDYTQEQMRQVDDGRAVLELDATDPSELENIKNNARLSRGIKWLSARPEKMTQKTRDLRRDVASLASDIQERRLPYWPSHNRDDYTERVSRFNEVSPKEFTEFRVWMKETWWGNHIDAPEIARQSPEFVVRQRLSQSLGSSARKLAELRGLL